MQYIRPAIILLILFTLLTGIIYPLAVTGIAQLIFPSKANGSLIEKNNHLVGSELIGQQFSSPAYFWSRLSATSPVPYNGASSTGSNYGPLNPALIDAVQNRIALLHQYDSTNNLPIPVDLVTSSASGLDPHISIASALYQISRVARERNIPVETLKSLVNNLTEGRDFGFMGEPRVNVLKLNLALDAMTTDGGKN